MRKRREKDVCLQLLVKEEVEGRPTPITRTLEEQSQRDSNSSSARLLIQPLCRRWWQETGSGPINRKQLEGRGERGGAGKWSHGYQQQLFTLISSKKRAVSPSIMGWRRGPLRLLEGEPCGWGGGGGVSHAETGFRARRRRRPRHAIRQVWAQLLPQPKLNWFPI